MNVGSLCSRPPVAAPTGASLSEVARLMRERHVGAVVITEGDPQRPRVAGIITDRDIVCARVTRTEDLSSINAAEIMTPHPLVIAEQDSVGAAVSHLRARGVRRAPVVASDGVLIGVVSADDLLAHLARQIAAMAGIVAQQIRTEGV